MKKTVTDYADLHLIGNSAMLTECKSAFLSSRQAPAAVTDRAAQWAQSQCETGRCVISGFHSPLEQQVLHDLLKGSQPIIIVLARGLPNRPFMPDVQRAIEQQRLLVVSLFPATQVRVTQDMAAERNRFILSQADEIVLGHVTPGGQLERLLHYFPFNCPVLHLADSPRKQASANNPPF